MELSRITDSQLRAGKKMMEECSVTMLFVSVEIDLTVVQPNIACQKIKINKTSLTNE